MKVYLYINEESAVYLAGLIDSSMSYSSDDISIYYSNQPVEGMTMMVSMTLDQFVYLKDEGFLKNYQLIMN